ncbi:unnamed protein product [Cylindrotheca closterium]|uniref:Uncharacterized protein n=1 Tax=Cylindrotheca closterium TaxID=2856 RepID=A0AAD2FLB5_9STRA|nr:unnamed protein product [Cylindrotheca closterium]
MYNPLQQHQSYYPSNPDEYANGYYGQSSQQQCNDADSLRGGSTMTIPEPETMNTLPEQQQQQEPFHPPKILLKHMSLALRVTCEWNRRLLAGVNRSFKLFNLKNRIRNDAPNEPQQQQPPSPAEEQLVSNPNQYYDQQELQAQPYGSRPVNIHPDRTWNPPIREGGPDLEQESLTIFHALTPATRNEETASDDDSVEDSTNTSGGEESSSPTDTTSASSNQVVAKPRGVAHWGPELLPYLEEVTELLQIDNNGLEIALAMIYLDRACSVNTIRSNGCPPCPFCLPRTVHRLSLVALVLAKQAVNGNNGGKTVQEYLEDLKPLGMPLDQLELMANWMINALGDNGSFVTVGQMKLWSENWESAFFPKRHRALQEQRQKEAQQRLLQLEQQRLMEEQRQQIQQKQQQQRYQQSYDQQQEAYNQGYQQPQQDY